MKRIEDVRRLRGGQYAEDSGPMAHPVRPESYISMDNFYTGTVYVKGAEVRQFTPLPPPHPPDSSRYYIISILIP